jgi:hypothetical protein
MIIIGVSFLIHSEGGHILGAIFSGPQAMSAPAIIQQQKADPAAVPVVFHAADKINNVQGPKTDFAGYMIKQGAIIKVRHTDFRPIISGAVPSSRTQVNSVG